MFELTAGQVKRLHIELDQIAESLVFCQVPKHLRDVEMQKTTNELLKLMENGEQYPNSETGLKWINRELAKWKYSGEI